MNKNILFAIGWPATIISAFIVGKVSVTSNLPETSDDEKNKVVRTVTRASSSGRYSSLGSGLTMAELEERIITTAKVSKTEFKNNFGIRKIMQIDDPIKRANLLLSVIENMSSDDFRKVVDDFRSLGITHQRMGGYTQLLHAWAKVDPDAALAYSQENKGSDTAEKIILASWAKDNPSAAIEWAKENYDGDGANPYLAGVIQGLASTDPGLATELLETLPRSRDTYQALEHLINNFSTGEPEVALAWLDSIADERLKQGASGRLIGRLAKEDPAVIAEWAASHEDATTQKTSLKAVASSWAKKDLSEASEWVSSLTSGQKVNAAQGLIGELIKEDPNEAADWMLTMQNEEDYQSLVNSYVWSAHGSGQPQAALSQIPNLESESMQNSAYTQNLMLWAREDVAAASEWLAANEVPEDVKTNATRIFEQIIEFKNGSRSRESLPSMGRGQGRRGRGDDQ